MIYNNYRKQLVTKSPLLFRENFITKENNDLAVLKFKNQEFSTDLSLTSSAVIYTITDIKYYIRLYLDGGQLGFPYPHPLPNPHPSSTVVV